MANQIQGLKKVAAANRNKTKSQLRDNNNNGGNDANQGHRGESMRQSA